MSHRAAEPLFDALTTTASLVTGTSIAWISLTDGERQWFKSRFGPIDTLQALHSHVFCEGAFIDEGVLEIPDVRTDARFAAHPWVVAAPYARFYAAAPIRYGNGTRVGTMCVMDTQPRTLTAPQRDGLMQLARVAAEALDLQTPLRDDNRAQIALRASIERFGIVARATNDMVWDWDLLQGSLWWNENMAEVLGYCNDELANIDGWKQRVHPADIERVVSSIYGVTHSTRTAWQEEYRFRHADGRYLEVFDRGFVIRDGDGVAVRMIGAMLDISTRKRIEHASHLHAMQQSLLAEFGQKALANTNLETITDEAVHVVSKGLGVSYCSAMQVAADGASLIIKAGCGWNDEWLGRRIALADEMDRAHYDMHFRHRAPVVVDNFSTEARFRPSALILDHAITSAAEVVIEGPSGLYGVLGAYSREPDTFGTDKVSFLRSIATILGTAVERVRSDEKVSRLAQFDALTELPNRNLFSDRIAQTLSQAERNGWKAGVLYIDLDRFKNVNDTYGHAVGDTLLMLVAQRLGTCVRSGDTVGRLGGDEFAIVMPELVSADQASQVAQRILAELAHPFKLDIYATYVTASIGISLYPSDGEDPNTLLQNADTAMYRAKEQGRNNFQFYTQALNARITRRINLERELRLALEREELELYYQPQVSLDTNTIVAAEALLRWNHPQRGLLEPAEFIGIAEESGLILPIGRWVADTACDQAVAWQRGGHPNLTMAVNVSPLEIRRGNVPAQIRAALQRSGVTPQYFEVEITESTVMDSAESFISTLTALKDTGVTIAIDDFGTGYSNLSYLKRFPIDTIKIDQSFIRDIVTDADDAVIVRAIIAMAHQLKLEVVAEGVMTDAQASFLHRNHIDLVQGFLFAPALNAVGFGDLLKSNIVQPPPREVFESARSLLLIDDDEATLRALKRTLRRDGYQIYTSSCASEAMEILARTPIGVIVTDDRMTEMSGSEFLARAKAVYPRTVRIMLAGYTDLKVVTAAVNDGAIYKFLTKPWEGEALREDIRQAFRQHELDMQL